MAERSGKSLGLVVLNDMKLEHTRLDMLSFKNPPTVQCKQEQMSKKSMEDDSRGDLLPTQLGEPLP
ncbi:hypothetical protein Goklo_010782, partial [Gossypium klotzschianum]|nr:hypothetical protein [Gossypium klotzschianum]